jgi:hypothetical protein
MICFFALFLFSCMGNKKNVNSNRYLVPQIDSLEGMFFYEGNVPYKCFTRLNQVEQSNNIIFFDEQITSLSIEQLYKKGVFYFTYPSLISDYIKQHKVSLAQNKNSIQKFEKKISFLIHKDDSAYNSTLYYDSSKILSFKKFYGKIYFFDLGKLEQFVPYSRNYECCYWNIKTTTQTFFITDISEVKIY